MMIYVIPDKPSILNYFIFFHGVLDFRVSATFEQPRFHENVPLAPRERYWHKIEGVDQWLASRIKEHGLFQNDWCSHNGDDAPGLTRLTAFEFLQKIDFRPFLWKLLWIPRSSWCRDWSSGFWVPRGCLGGGDHVYDEDPWRCEVIMIIEALSMINCCIIFFRLSALNLSKTHT